MTWNHYQCTNKDLLLCGFPAALIIGLLFAMNELKEDFNPQSGKSMYGNVASRCLPCWCGASISPTQGGIRWRLPRGLIANSSALGKNQGLWLDPTFFVPDYIRRANDTTGSEATLSSGCWSRETPLPQINEWPFWPVKQKLFTLTHPVAVGVSHHRMRASREHGMFSNQTKTTGSFA